MTPAQSQQQDTEIAPNVYQLLLVKVGTGCNFEID